jgi:hypothetical protein
MKNSALVSKIVLSALSAGIALSLNACGTRWISVNDLPPSAQSDTNNVKSSDAVKAEVLTQAQMKQLFEGHDAATEMKKYAQRVTAIPQEQITRTFNPDGSIEILVKNPDGSFFTKFSMVKKDKQTITDEVDQNGHLKNRLIINNFPDSNDTEELQMATPGLKYVYKLDKSGNTIGLKVFTENTDGSVDLIEKDKTSGELISRPVNEDNFISKNIANIMVKG